MLLSSYTQLLSWATIYGSSTTVVPRALKYDEENDSKIYKIVHLITLCKWFCFQHGIRNWHVLLPMIEPLVDSILSHVPFNILE